MDSTENLALPYIMPSQAQKHVTHNEALRVLDALVQLSVIDKDLATPPGSPTPGARYIVGPGASDEWAGHVNSIAAWQDGAWAFYAPGTGWTAWVHDESQLYVFSGAGWISAPGSGAGLVPKGAWSESETYSRGDLVEHEGYAFVSNSDDNTNNEPDAGTPGSTSAWTYFAIVTGGGGGGTGDVNPTPLVGVNATADTTDRLSVSSPATLFSHDGDDHRLKINKALATDTASVIFQSDFVGHAEFGLAGNNDWQVKTSPDGETWNHPLTVAASDGKITINEAIWDFSAINMIGQGSGGYCFTVSNTNADNTNKGGAVFTGAQYSNADTPFMVIGPWSTHLDNRIYYGGGGWHVPDATDHWFYAGAHSPGTNNTATRAFTVNNTGVWSHRTNAPFTDNAHSLGTASLRWSVVYAATGVINTSDERLKTDIEPVPLGLNFVRDLEPVAYRWKSGGHELVTQREAPAADAPPSDDPVAVEVAVPRRGTRTHYGLIAQQVKQALDTHGAEDFAGWTLADRNDPASEQGLRYDQFVPILVKAVQELAAELESLREKSNM